VAWRAAILPRHMMLPTAVQVRPRVTPYRRAISPKDARPGRYSLMSVLVRISDLSHVRFVPRLGAIACSSAHRPLPLSSRDNL
jgi:hypothetical protein